MVCISYQSFKMISCRVKHILYKSVEGIEEKCTEWPVLFIWVSTYYVAGCYCSMCDKQFDYIKTHFIYLAWDLPFVLSLIDIWYGHIQISHEYEI